MIRLLLLLADSLLPRTILPVSMFASSASTAVVLVTATMPSSTDSSGATRSFSTFAALAKSLSEMNPP